MSRFFKLQTIIQAGQANSDAFDTGGALLVGVNVQASPAFNGTGLTLQVSEDQGVNWSTLNDATGTAITIKTVNGKVACPSPATVAAFSGKVRFVSDAANTASIAILVYFRG